MLEGATVISGWMISKTGEKEVITSVKMLKNCNVESVDDRIKLMLKFRYALFMEGLGVNQVDQIQNN